MHHDDRHIRALEGIERAAIRAAEALERLSGEHFTRTLEAMERIAAERAAIQAGAQGPREVEDAPIPRHLAIGTDGDESCWCSIGDNHPKAPHRIIQPRGLRRVPQMCFCQLNIDHA